MKKIKWSEAKLEYNDIRALLTLINVILIIELGVSIAWFGLIVAIFGIIKDLTEDKKWNGLIMHTANLILNLYFLQVGGI